MSDEVLKNALLPFFSTKEKGHWLGAGVVPRNRRCAPREACAWRAVKAEGIEVSIWLPSPPCRTAQPHGPTDTDARLSGQLGHSSGQLSG